MARVTYTRTAPRRLAKSLPKKQRGGTSVGETRNTRTTAPKPDPAIEAYNKAVSDYNKAVDSGNFAAVEKAAQSLKSQPKSGGQLTQQQQQQLDTLKTSIDKRNQEAQQKAAQLRQEQITKATAAKRPENLPRYYAGPKGTTIKLKSEAQVEKERDEYNQRAKERRDKAGKFIKGRLEKDPVVVGLGAAVTVNKKILDSIPYWYKEEVKRNLVQSGVSLGKAGKEFIDRTIVSAWNQLPEYYRKQYASDVKEGIKENVQALKDAGGEFTDRTAGAAWRLTPEWYQEEVEQNLQDAGGFYVEAGRRVQETAVPALTLDETVYLPEGADIRKYNELKKQSNLSPIKLEDGKVGINFEGGLKGGELGGFLRKQQKVLEADLKRYNEALSNLDKAKNNPEFKALEKKIKDTEKNLEKLSQNQNATEKDVEEFNKIKQTYESDIKNYNKLYNDYEQKFRTADSIEKRIDRGYRGTGWKMLQEAADDFQKRTGKDITLARSLLKAGVEAYKAQRVVLAAQTGGTLLAGTNFGAGLLSSTSRLSTFLGSKAVIGTTGTTLGAISAGQEFQRSGDLGYTIGAGLGTASGFLSASYSKSIVETGIKGLEGIQKGIGIGVKKAPRLIQQGVKQFVKDVKTLKADKGAEYIDGSKTKSKYDVEYTKKLYEDKLKGGGPGGDREFPKGEVEFVRGKIRKLTFEEQVRLFREGFQADPDKARFLKKAKLFFSKKVIATGQTQMPTKIIREIFGGTQQKPRSDFSGSIFGEPSQYASTGKYELTKVVNTDRFGPNLDTRFGPNLDGSGAITPEKTLMAQQDASAISGLFLPADQQLKTILTTDLVQEPRITTNTFSLLAIKQDSGLDSKQESKQESRQRSSQDTAQDTIQDTVLDTGQITDTIVNTSTNIINRQRYRKKRIDKLKTPQLMAVDIGYPELTKKKKEQGYYAEYRPEGQKKFKKINKKPQTLMSALSTMARKVDQTLSARGRVIRSKKKVSAKARGKSKIIDTKDNYFKRNQYKFRPYKIKRGKKSSALQKGEFIEKAQYRLDKPGESRRIQRTRGRKTPFGF